MPILSCVTFPVPNPTPAPGQPPFIFHPPFGLVVSGPMVVAEIGFDQSFFGATPKALPGPATDGQSASSQPDLAIPPASAVPSVMGVLALIDTGASNSCIDDQLAQQLQLPLINKVSVGGVGGGDMLSLYLGRLTIPALNFSTAGQFIGAKMTEGGQQQRALIGRDLLMNMLMVYDGRTGSVTLAI